MDSENNSQLTDLASRDPGHEPFDFFANNHAVEEAETFIKKLPKPWLTAATAVIVCTAVLTLILLRTCLSVTPTYARVGQKVNKPFVVNLNETVQPLKLSQIKISPEVSGKWTFKSGLIIGSDQLIFTPKDYFKADTSYSVKLPDVNKLLIGSSQIEKINFKTEPAPILMDVGIKNTTDNSIIAADYEFTVKLSTPTNGLRKLELRTTPEIPMTETSTGDQQFTWKPKTLLPQGTNIDLKVYDSKNDTVLTSKTLKVTPEPVISVPVKKSYFMPSDVATITFNQPIDPASSKDISFSVPGQGKWQSDTVYAFAPTKVTPGQTYSYVLKAGLRSKSGGILTADQSVNFSTVGPVGVIGSSPQGNSLSQASERVSFTFDQAVDHTSVQNRFSISSGKVTGMTWSGNTFTATVTDLGFQQTVTATLAPGIQNTGFGLPSTQTFRNTFTTEPRTAKLNIPYYHQQFAASCAAASLRMALAYRGINTDDMAIVNAMGYNPTVEDKSTDPPTWDDPWEMFVGSVSGTIRTGTSAGPDAQPVAKAAASFGVSASAQQNISASWIAQQLYNGNPVIVFGAYSKTAFTSWKTPSGRIEVMNQTSHAFVATGVMGEPGNPIGFWISDPISGNSYITAAQMSSSINLDAYHQAVVVY